ncbi:putative pectinesterase/pectinesterase inhibitor 7 [Nicotiana tabacum]|uniref:Pectinesterase/pectinesterase inhibitor 7 n=1 Tax=Nicotiana tabacum TaxID=4097 RepID=A0AC58UII9_TOBAC
MVFQNCLIEARMPLPGQYITITAQQKNGEKEATRLVLQTCTLKLETPDTEFHRPIDKSKRMDRVSGRAPIRPFYMEFNNRVPGVNTTGRVMWAHVTSDPKVASSFLLGILSMVTNGYPPPDLEKL